jgi:hypothetical protein
LVVHFFFSGLVWLSAGPAMTKSHHKNRTKNRDRRHQQYQGPDVQVSGKSAVAANRRSAHNALGRRGFSRQRAKGYDGHGHHYQMQYRFARHIHF